MLQLCRSNWNIRIKKYKKDKINMKAAFKWRLQNGIYGYLIDEDNQNRPFAYDISNRSRIYPDGTIETGTTVNEGEISTTVSKFSRDEYINAFNSFKSFINESYPQVSLLDVMYYYNIENDECTTSASSLKCSATDIIFDATAVEGSELSVVVTNEQTDPNTGDALRYRLDFTFPNTTPSGGTVVYSSVTSDVIISSSITSETITVDELTVNNFNTTNVNTENITSTTITTSAITTSSITSNEFNATNINTENITSTTIATSAITTSSTTSTNIAASAITTSSVTSNSFVKNGGTSDQYLMADGGVTTLTAGTNVTITKDATTGVVTISSQGGGSDYYQGRNITINNNIINAEGYDYNSALTSVAIGKYEQENVGTGQGIALGGGFLRLETGNFNDFNIGDLITHADFPSTVYKVTGKGTSPNGLYTNPTFPSSSSVNTIYKLTFTNMASGENSFAAGLNTIAAGNSMAAFGKHNYTSGVSTADSTIFVIGNGNNVDKHDLFKVEGTFDYNQDIDNAKISLSGDDIISFDNDSGHNSLLIQNGNVKIRLIPSLRDDIYTSGITHCKDEVYAKVNGVSEVQLGIPIGSITMWAGTTAPYGWLLCNGYKIELTSGSSTDYDWAYDYTGHGSSYTYYKIVKSNDKKFINLLGVITTIYGFDGTPPSNITAVYLPNLQQRFPIGALAGGTIGKMGTGETVVGWSTSLGASGGTSGQTLSIEEMPSHTHKILHGESSTDADDGVSFTENNVGYKLHGENVSPDPKPIIEKVGQSQPHNNIPPYLAINFIIKYK